MKMMGNPLGQLKKHQHYFADVTGKKIANICGSNGRKAVPLALLGADVTVFDISEENRKYALELAEAADTKIAYVVTDIYQIDMSKYNSQFDILYLEGGILHYFHQLDEFIKILYALLRAGGQLILSDFHPLRKCVRMNDSSLIELEHGYFDENIYSGEVAYKHYFAENEQPLFPNVSLRFYTISDIINAVIAAGFQLKRFDEHRGWNDENIPWEFTIFANKC